MFDSANFDDHDDDNEKKNISRLMIISIFFYWLNFHYIIV